MRVITGRKRPRGKRSEDGELEKGGDFEADGKKGTAFDGQYGRIVGSMLPQTAGG